MDNNGMSPLIKYLLIPFMFAMFLVVFVVPSLNTAVTTQSIERLDDFLSYLSGHGYTAIASPSGTLNTQDIAPTANNTYDIGSNTYQYNDAYINTLRAINVYLAGSEVDLSSPSQGQIIYYNGTKWLALAPGTSGDVLRTGGILANPSWGKGLPTIPLTGDLAYYNGSNWVSLGLGSSNHILTSSGTLPQWSANISSPIGRTATYVVAASDALVHVKAQADYICEGADDQDTIQQAINDVIANGGKGTVSLSEGNFLIGDGGLGYAVQIPQGNGYAINLIGQGSATTLSASDNIVYIDIEDGSAWGATTENREWQIKNIRFYSSSAGAGKGIYLGAYSCNYEISGCTFDNMRFGIDSTYPSGRGTIHNNRFWHLSSSSANDVAAIHLYGAHDTDVTKNQISYWESGEIAGAAARGIWIQGGATANEVIFDVRVSGNEIEDIHSATNNAEDIAVNGNNVVDVFIEGNIIAECDYGIVVNQQNNTFAFPGVSIRNNHIHLNNFWHIILLYANGVTVEGNTIFNKLVTDTCQGINARYSADNVFIGRNVLALLNGEFTSTNYIAFTDGADIDDADIWGNKGYTTENSGSVIITNGAISTNVTHGLTTTPTSVIVTGTHNEVNDVVVTSIDVTQFTISTSSNVTGDRYVYWKAEIR